MPAEDQASCFFFSNYVVGLEATHNSIYEYLPGLYNETHSGSALSLVIVALGLVGLSTHRSAPELMSIASRHYNSALRLVNTALRHPAMAKADQTLVSVVLLGLYETNTCYAPRSMRSWLKHIKGAVALLELRGEQQFHTELGLRLFAHLRAQIITYCIQTRIPVPETILALSDLFQHQTANEDDAVGARLATVHAEFCKLRADIASPHSNIDTIEIISHALTIDTKLALWYAGLPSTLLPLIMTLNDPTPQVLSDQHHSYRDLRTAALLNHYRTVRLLAHEVILHQLSVLHQHHSQESDLNANAIYNFPPLYAYQVHHCESAILTLISDICASVPFHTSYHSPRSVSRNHLPTPPRAAAGNAILWPLYVAAQLTICPDLTRTWIIGRLHHIGTEMGVQQATTLAKILCRRKEVTELLVESEGDEGIVEEEVERGQW